MNKEITFDEVMLSWLTNEVKPIKGRDLHSFIKVKGFSSIIEWRLATALRLGMNTKEWSLESMTDPNAELPNIIIGPYQGWSQFFDNELNTTFANALEIPEFFEWCNTHDRIQPIAQQFPNETKLILYRTPNGELIHIEGGHRICAIAYQTKIGQPIDFTNRKVDAYIADISENDISKLREFLKLGTFKQ